MTKTPQMLLLTLWFILAGCAGLAPTAAPVVISPNPTATATPIPTDTPPTTIPAPTLTPTPVPESRWQCYRGGVACYDNLYTISMLNAQEGWAGGRLHYTTAPGQPEPTWQLSNAETFLTKVSVVGPDEWWGVDTATLWHYKDGVLLEVNHLPEGTIPRHLSDLAVVAPDDVWVVGEEGFLVHYSQGQLEAVEVSEKHDLKLIAMLNGAEGWAVGEVLLDYIYDAPRNILLHYQQGEWTVTPLPGDPERTYDFKDIALVNEREAWLVGDAVFHYQNGNWQEVPDILEEGVMMTGIDMVSETEGWATTNQPYLLHYQQGQWQQVASPTENTLNAIDLINAEKGWAVGNLSTVLYYDQDDWEVVSEGTKLPHLSDIDWVEDEGWAVGSNGTIMRYQAGEWQPVNSPLDPSFGLRLEAVDMVSPEEGWAVGWEGVFLHYTQGVWQFSPNPITQGMTDLEMINENEGWAVGGSLNDGPIIAHYQDGVWSQVTSPGEGYYLSAIDMVNK